MTVIKSAGTPIIDKLDLITTSGDKIDLTPIFKALILYEDMFSPVLTGNITISDTLGLLDKLPICGNEQLTVRFYSYNYSSENQAIDYIHRTFDIIRIDDVNHIKDFEKIYTLQFASPELKLNELLKISKSYKDFRISEIITQIMTSEEGLKFSVESLKEPVTEWGRSPYLTSDNIEAEYELVDENNAVELFVEKTKNIESVVTFPYTKPLDMVRNLSNKAIRACQGRSQSQYDIANFMFFENKRGFQFTSLETLMESKEISDKLGIRLVYGNAAQNISGSQRDVSVQSIEKLQIQRSYDILKNINTGMYASQMITYDIHTGEVNTVDFDMVDEFYKSETTNRFYNGNKDYPPIPLNEDETNDITKEYNSKRMLIPVNTREYNNITSRADYRNNNNSTYIGAEQYLQKRISCLTRLSNFKLQFQIPGNSRHKVGDCIFIDLSDYEFERGGIKSIPSKYYSGYYLLTSIKHVLTPLSYKMQVEAVADSIPAKINNK